MTDHPDLEARIAAQLASAAPPPPPNLPDSMSVEDIRQGMIEYATPGSDSQKMIDQLVQKISLEEAAHGEAFTCEVFGVTAEEHQELAVWLQGGATGPEPVAVHKLATPVPQDWRLLEIIAKYRMLDNPARRLVLKAMYRRLHELARNEKLRHG